MKKLYTLALLLVAALWANAQVEVTLSVDMTGQTVSPNGVFLAGDIQSAAGGSDWSPGDPNFELTDPDGNGVYAVTITVSAPGDYLYKYVNDNTWGNNEGGGLTADCGVDDGYGAFNRGITVPDEASFVEVTYLYDSCTESDLAINNVTETVSTIDGIKIAPNPMSDVAFVSFDNPTNAVHNVTVTTLTGQVVRTIPGVRGDTFQIEKGNLIAGVYFVTFQNEAGEVGAEKLIVR
jgi:hypothetical protein